MRRKRTEGDRKKRRTFVSGTTSRAKTLQCYSDLYLVSQTEPLGLENSRAAGVTSQTVLLTLFFN